MERILQSTAATISQSWYEDGTLIDPGTVTIGITREDGTTLVAGGTATSGTGANPRTFTLTTTHTASLDVFTLTWTSATKGTLVSYVEVVGGFLFSLTEARNTKPLDNTTLYTVAEITAARTAAETALEEACGVSFVPRYFREVVDGSGTCDVLLSPRPLSITSAVVGETSSFAGTALTAAELADLRLYKDGRVYHSGVWTYGRGNVEIKGTHGYKFPPPRVGIAALKLAKWILVDTPVDERAVSVSTEGGSVQFFGSPVIRDAVFSIPECRIVVDVYGVNGSVG